MPRRAIACTLLCAVAVAGCSGDRDTKEGRRISQAVQRFSLARGPEACDMLTTKGLEDNYGGDTRVQAKDRCLARARLFRGQRIDITFVQITDGVEAHATAKVHGGRRYYSVGLSKQHGRWLIDSVAPTTAK